MAAVLEHLPNLIHTAPIQDVAQAISRYYTISWASLINTDWHTPAFLQFYSTFEKWSNIGPGVWHELQSTNLTENATALYKWSLENQRAQDEILRRSRPLSMEPLHARIAHANLDNAVEGRALLLGTSVHWNLWTIFNEGSLILPKNRFSRYVTALSLVTPISFEHAITECYQHEPKRFTNKSCMALLNMDITRGHALTTCSGVLLLYHRFREPTSKTMAAFRKKHPNLLEGFDVHLGVYPDINDALLHANALMPHWQRCIHQVGDNESLALPANLLD